MDDLKELQERLRQQRPVEWEKMPDFALYMDQVLSYMDRQVIRFDEDDSLTAAMVNNYTKSGLVPRAEGKKYNRDHLAYLTAICILKQVLSAKDIDLLIREMVQGAGDIQDGYASFCSGLDRVLNATADEIDTRSNESLAYEAIHFALLSYASHVACSRYVSLLRQQKETAESEEKAAKGRGKKEKERD